MRSEEKDRRREKKGKGIREATLRRSRDIFSVTVGHESRFTNNYMRVRSLIDNLFTGSGSGAVLLPTLRSWHSWHSRLFFNFFFLKWIERVPFLERRRVFSSLKVVPGVYNLFFAPHNNIFFGSDTYMLPLQQYEGVTWILHEINSRH